MWGGALGRGLGCDCCFLVTYLAYFFLGDLELSERVYMDMGCRFLAMGAARYGVGYVYRAEDRGLQDLFLRW